MRPPVPASEVAVPGPVAFVRGDREAHHGRRGCPLRGRAAWSRRAGTVADVPGPQGRRDYELGAVQLDKLDKAMLRTWQARFPAGRLKPATVPSGPPGAA